MMCAKCKAKLVVPVKKCAAGVEPYVLKCGHLGCAYNSATVAKAMKQVEPFPARRPRICVNLAELSDEDLIEIFKEGYGWKETGQLKGEKLHELEKQWFGEAAGMLTAIEEATYFEMARRYANQKAESHG